MRSAPVFVVEPGRLRQEATGPYELVLDGAEGHHAAQVRRVQAGEQVDLVDGVGGRGHAVATSVERGRVRLRVEASTVEPRGAPWVVVVQALAKGDRGERAVELLTEAGVDEIVPWEAARSVVQWRGERGERALERWRSTAREASKQARRARFPQVPDPATTSDVAARLGAASLGVVLTGDATARLPDLPMPPDGEVVLVVGPEGDVTDGELAAFDAAGAQRAAMGPTVMRTSTAGAIGAALVLSRTRW